MGGYPSLRPKIPSKPLKSSKWTRTRRAHTSRKQRAAALDGDRVSDPALQRRDGVTVATLRKVWLNGLKSSARNK